MEGIHGSGKGDIYRQVDYVKYSKNWDKIFQKSITSPKKKKVDKSKKKGNI